MKVGTDSFQGSRGAVSDDTNKGKAFVCQFRGEKAMNSFSCSEDPLGQQITVKYLE